LNRWKNYFCHLFNVHGVKDIQTDINARSWVHEPSCFENEIATGKLKRYKSPGIHKILAVLIQAGGNTQRIQTQIFVNSVWNKDTLPQKWNESVIVPTYKRVINLALVIIKKYNCYQLHTKLYPIFISRALLHT
jgi:hypothetical protein